MVDNRNQRAQPRASQRQTRTAERPAIDVPLGTQSAEAPPAISQREKRGLFGRFGDRFGIDAERLFGVLKSTAFRPVKIGQSEWREATNEELIALMIVADQYKLNPFTREIYAFPQKGGGIVPLVGVDGWIRIIQEHPQFDGMEFRKHFEGDKIDWSMECEITRKDRSKPFLAEEYYAECYREANDNWVKMPRRMLRNRAIIQAGRLAFGFAGIYDPDGDGRDIIDNMALEGRLVDAPRGKPPTERPRAMTLPARETKAAAGETNGHAAETTAPADAPPPPVDAPVDPATGQVRATAEQLAHVRKLLDGTGVPENGVCEKFDLGVLEDLGYDQVAEVVAWINNA
ncbi:MAG: RecT family recombinase, partial [Steroidobacteraceae bacterium]